jgi:putative ABC transport system permease protein
MSPPDEWSDGAEAADETPTPSWLPGTRASAAVGIAIAQVRHYRVRSVLSVVGIALGVVLVVSLAGLGYGLTTTGDEAIDYLDHDLWATGGQVELAPGGVGGVANPIPEAHRTTERFESHERVRDAQALAFQTVYVSDSPDEFDTIAGVGLTGNGSRVVGGGGFSTDDVHYANGSYDGPMTHEIFIDERTAARYDVGVNDTLYIGGTIYQAERNEFRIVGVTRSFSRFLGVPTVAMHLSELHEVSGTTRTDRAGIMGVTLTNGAPPEQSKQELEQAYPAFEFRTNDEQVSAIIGRQASVLAGAGTLVLLAVVAGIALVVNTLALVVYHQREALAAMKAIGVRGRTLGVLVGTQGILFGLFGGVLGCALVPPLVTVVNGVVGDLTGFGQLIKTPLWLYGVGLGIALSMGLLGSLVAGWRAASIDPLKTLSRR